MKGIVYKSTGSWYVVKGENNQFYECRIKGKFRIKGIKNTNPLAVGDNVIFEIESKSGKEWLQKFFPDRIISSENQLIYLSKLILLQQISTMLFL